MSSKNLEANTLDLKRNNDGFTLIELMVVVAIVSILAVIALPAYLDYVVRSKVSEAMVFVAEAKTSVSEAYYSTRVIPTSNELAGLPPAAEYDKHEYISRLEILSSDDPGAGTIEVTIKMPGDEANGKKLHLVPSTAIPPTMTWKCNSPLVGGLSINKAPPSCRG
ncbi:MAG: pilin [Halioglobus sp.]